MPDLKEHSLTVSIVSYDSSEQELKAVLGSLLTALANLFSAENQYLTRVVFIDNSNDNRLKLAVFDQFRESLKALSIELRLLQGHGNIGYGRGHNLAILSGHSEYHLMMNPDIELAPNCLVEGISYLQQHPQVAIVSPAASNRSGEQQYLCRRYPTLLTLLIRGFLPARIKAGFQSRLASDEMQELPQDRPTEGVPLVSGCFMLCRTRNLQELSGFDEKYFMYFEDFDLSLRIGKTARLDYLPTMRIKHYGGNAAGKGFKHILMFTKSAWRFFNTHGWRVV